MKIQGFEIVFSGYNFNPERHEVTSMLKREIEYNSTGSVQEWKKMTFAQKCDEVRKIKGVERFFVDAVRGVYLG